MNEPQGPWSFPPAPPAPLPARPKLRAPPGLVIWLALIGVAVVAYFALTAAFPGQLSDADQVDALRAIGLMALVSSSLVVTQRIRFGRAARNLALWLGFAAAILIGYSFRSQIAEGAARLQSELVPSYAVPTAPNAMTISASDDGSFYVMGKVNGALVRFVIDTGANGVLLSPADAKRAGIDPATLDFASPSETANGVGHAAPAKVPTLDIGAMRLTNVPVEVDKTPMSASLLGMSFLDRLDSLKIHGDQMVLTWKR